MTTHDLAARQSREADMITAVLAAPCGLACAGSVIPGLDARRHPRPARPRRARAGRRRRSVGRAVGAGTRRGPRRRPHRGALAGRARAAPAHRGRPRPPRRTDACAAVGLDRFGGGVMWGVTGWALRIWLRITILVALGVGAAWLWCPPGWFPLAVIGAAVIELWAIRALAREWS